MKIDGTLFYLNGNKIKFHGVNHHDTSCTNGYTLTPDEIERDMKICKEYNIDTVRTSHYPPDPFLLEICDELGIYVVDEADLETHGTLSHKLPPSYNRISRDPAWYGHYMDRVRRLYQRDKMHVSIFMWSLGKIMIETDSHSKAAAEQNKDLLLTIVTVDTQTGREAAREQLVLEERFAKAPADAGKTALPEGVAVHDGGLEMPIGGDRLTAYKPRTILFRAATDNDRNLLGQNAMSDFMDEKEEVISVDREENRIMVVSRITCKKQIFTCTDIYEGSREGILVTSRLHCEKGKGKLPRFGKTFRLDASFDDIRYYARNGESYADMKEQFQIEETTCKVADMTEPNIKPQESGNRCDCRWISVSNGQTKVTFTAVGKAFELGIKPYGDRELADMKHREDEVRTGTYVTISAFQMGIGTGICGPATAPEYCYSMKEDYELKFVIRAEA